MTDAPTTHLYVLLDRSGSMNAIRDDVIGGFNRLLHDQRSDGPDARVTLVQFDSHAPHEVVADAVPIAEMVPLDAATFLPRGSTPLLDATGLLITRASAHAAERIAAGLPAEHITFVTITDGLENASREYSRNQIVALVAERESAGWTFVYLGATVEAYSEAGRMGYDPRSTQAWAPDGSGSQQMFASTSRALRSRRAKLRRGEAFDAGDFFEGTKEAEDDRRRRYPER